MIAVVDYGVSNLRSVVRAFAAGGHEATLTSDPDRVSTADRVVVPGVGHFGRAAATLGSSGLGDAILAVARRGLPVLGICLGMQLFFERSEESPGAVGLGLLAGEVRHFATDLPVPHVGWSPVTLAPAGQGHSLLGAALEGEPRYFYHVHSFHPAPSGMETVLATADYGGTFPTIVGSGSVIGTQFHPEKSQREGIALLDAFARWAP